MHVAFVIVLVTLMVLSGLAGGVHGAGWMAAIVVPGIVALIADKAILVADAERRRARRPPAPSPDPETEARVQEFFAKNVRPIG